MSSSALKGRVLIIAGSDSGGGAGIQADIKAVSALGGFAMTAVTAVTAQNTLGVSAIHPVPEDIIAAQIKAVMDDLPPQAIKTGMLHSAEVIETVASAIAPLGGEVPLVVDPVMIAKGGASLLEQSAVAALKDRLLPLATLVTPNIPEAKVLTGLGIVSAEDQIAAGRALTKTGAGAALVKGGHLDGGEVRDVLVLADGTIHVFTNPRIDTRHTHGTGCTLASAIAVRLAQGWHLSRAVESASRYVHNAILTAPGFGSGHGPLNHFHGQTEED